MILASLAMGAFSATAADNNSAIYFNTSQPVNDLQGSLAAEVKFAQSQILPAHPKEGDSQPHLTSQRKSLLLVRPVKADDKTPVQVEARDSNDKILGTLILSPPSALPDTCRAAARSRCRTMWCGCSARACWYTRAAVHWANR